MSIFRENMRILSSVYVVTAFEGNDKGNKLRLKVIRLPPLYFRILFLETWTLLKFGEETKSFRNLGRWWPLIPDIHLALVEEWSRHAASNKSTPIAGIHHSCSSHLVSPLFAENKNPQSGLVHMSGPVLLHPIYMPM